MADKISAYNRAGFDISQARNRKVDQAERAGETGAQRKLEPGRDAVEISGSVDNMRQIESRLRDLPDVDRERVDSMRAKLEAGEYQVDAERLARKLQRLEQDLG